MSEREKRDREERDREERKQSWWSGVSYRIMIG